MKRNNETIQKFLIFLDRKGLSEKRIYKYKVLLRKLDDIDLDNISKDQIDKFFFSIKNSSNLSGDTKQDYWNMFRILLRWIKPDINFMEYKLIVKKKRKLPEEILSLDEVKKIVVFAKSIRDRAMLSLLYDLGCRPGELLNIKNKDITFDENGLTISLDGKTGMRKIPVITTLNSARFLKEWLLISKKSPEDFVFDGICIERFNQIVKETSIRTEITKRVYSYLFRHSRATHLAKYLTEQQEKIYLGWSMDSKMVGTYVHLSGRDLNEKVLELNGENVASDTSTTSNSLQGNLIQAVLTLSQEVNDLKKQMLSMNQEPVKVEA